MAPVASTVTPFSSMGHQLGSRQSQLLITLIHGPADIPPNRRSGPPSTTDHVGVANVYSTGTLTLSSSFGSNRPQSKISCLPPPAETQAIWGRSNSVGGILETSLVPNPLSFNNSGSTLQRRALWCDYFSKGCSSHGLSNLSAKLLVSYAPWTDKSTVGLLANMFREGYCQVLICPRVVNTAASRVITFLKAVENWVTIKRGAWTSIEFRASLRKTAIDGFYLSAELVNISPVTHL
jgi:hypothetical protein